MASRRGLALLPAALVAALALGLPAALAAASPAQLAVSVAKSSFIKRDPGSQWDTLHPRYKAVVSKARFVACERKAAAAAGKITVVDVSAEGTRVFTAKLPLLGNVKVNDVTLAITYRQGSARTSQIAEFDSLWVSHRGRWVRIYAPADYQAYKSGRCP